MNVLPKRRGNAAPPHTHPPVTPQAQRVLLGMGSRLAHGLRLLLLAQGKRVLLLVSQGHRMGLVGASGGIPGPLMLLLRRVALIITNDDYDELFDGNIHFNENRNVILNNFEEWIRLATDNKINLKNTWNVGLIEYFNDMNVIMEGSGVNFQKASATLDGCMKIYLSRVELAAHETGKLLSGLANKREGDVEAADEEDEEEDEEASAAKRKRVLNKVVDSTLVKFDTIRIKKLEQELLIDPLFKKALAEFDEGGAKSLLLNTLSTDKSGRVVFAATLALDEPASEDVDMAEPAEPINFGKLESIVFRDDDLDGLGLCPLFKQFQLAIDDFSQAKGILLEFSNKIEAAANETVPFALTPFHMPEDPPAFEPEDAGYADYGDYEADEDPGTILEPQLLQTLFAEPEAPVPRPVKTTSETLVLDRHLMAYFDERMKVDWRGPDHWRVKAIKQTKFKLEATPGPADTSDAAPAGQRPRKEPKEPVVIDFMTDAGEVDEDELFRPPKNPSKPKGLVDPLDTLLPNDIRYNSKRLTNLFTKPDMLIVFTRQSGDDVLTDENYFAQQYEQQKQDEDERERQLAQLFHQAEYDDYNHDYDDGIDFNDVLAAEPQPELDIKPLAKRRDMISFSRVAKRVDIKLLKDNIWRQIKTEEPATPKPEASPAVSPEPEHKEQPLKFAKLVLEVGSLYEQESRKDLSTSFCFICLLHLANEHGLSLKTNEAHDDLEITGF